MTCGNTRCEHHFDARLRDEGAPQVALTTLELPFAYTEHGESKSALVKVVLCRKCVKKLMWKRTKEKERHAPPVESLEDTDVAIKVESGPEEDEQEMLWKKKRPRKDEDQTERSSRRRRSSRSRSPRPSGTENRHSRRRHSPLKTS